VGGTVSERGEDAAHATVFASPIATPTILPADAERLNLAIQGRLALFTGFLVLVGAAVGVMQIRLMFVQADLQRDALSQTTKAADAATGGAATSALALKLSQRAYLTTDNWNMEIRMLPGDAAGLGDVDLNVKNTGNTPATVVGGQLAYAIAQNIADVPGYGADAAARDVGGFRVLRGSDLPMFRQFPIAIAQWQALQTGNLFIYVWGRVDYTDVFGDQHFLDFGRRYSAVTHDFRLDSMRRYNAGD
jgi:hypothetical protein